MTEAGQSTRVIMHIAGRTDWEAAQRAGEYRAASLAVQGFIHLSKPEQVIRVANALYRGRRDLVLLSIDPARLRAELRYEPPDHPADDQPPSGEVFPHLYGPLNLDAVIRAAAFAPGPDGLFALPADT